MRLVDLNPSLTWSPYGGKIYSHQLSFDCPLHVNQRIMVCCQLNGVSKAHPGVWSLTLPDQPSGDGWSGVTLKPSIINDTHGRKQCGFHCSIIDGTVIIDKS